jgi:hypothetical protein
MQGRFFDHEFNLLLSIHLMAFQVKFLADRNENSMEMFIQHTDSLFCYKNVSNDENDDVDGEKAIQVTNRNLHIDHGVFLIKDTDFQCFDKDRGNYFSNRRYITDSIYDLLSARYPENLPEGFPICHFASEISKESKRKQSRMQIHGSKEDIIRFCDALIEMVKNPDLQLPVAEQPKKNLLLPIYPSDISEDAATEKQQPEKDRPSQSGIV